MSDMSYSGRVLDAARELIARNPGRELQLAAALRRFHHRARIDPQFGQPLRDLSAGALQLGVGVVSPLVFHYILDEANRRVMIVRPPLPIPHAGLN